MESPRGRILQGASAGQYFDTEPDEELLLLELLEELLDDELEELLVEELLLDVEDELLLDELDEVLDELDELDEAVPPQPISSNALTEARQIPRRVRKLVIGVS